MSAGLATPIATARRVASSWKEEASRRRRISQHDPTAEALDYCAAELLEELRPLEDPVRTYTVAEFAADQSPPVTPQCVRQWIKRGEIPATRGPHGWQIPRAARRPIRRRHAS